MLDQPMKITYTLTDESPRLATYSLWPIVQAYLEACGIELEIQDISLARRILGAIGELLPESARQPDPLPGLARLVEDPACNLIKLPNISASLPQLKAALEELHAAGIPVPPFPEKINSEKDRHLYTAYSAVLGSAVNPVLRQGNAERRIPAAVKNHARKHPHAMSPWASDSRARVAWMNDGDFFSSEQSLTLQADTLATMELHTAEGEVITFRNALPLRKGDIVDSSCMRRHALDAFLEEQMQKARTEGLLYSLHLKATMMKASHPVIFGRAVKIFFHTLFKRHGEQLRALGLTPEQGIGGIKTLADGIDPATSDALNKAIQQDLARGPELAMADAEAGITNLDAPNLLIIDASMPAMIRNGGRMYDREGKPKDTLAIIPDRAYATLYQEVIEDCQNHGQFNPATVGTVINIGLMADKAEEYGSHDKTFVTPVSCSARLIDAEGRTLLEQDVEAGDIWMVCQTGQEAVDNWIELAIQRAHELGMPAVFWLDAARPHDRILIDRVEEALSRHNQAEIESLILPPREAMRYTLQRFRNGQDTLAVTGNILRDYLTDLFPIIEVGTSAKVLSIVSLMKGGYLYETGAGGTAPALMKQFMETGHLAWDSLGEFMALSASLELFARRASHPAALTLGEGLDQAIESLLAAQQCPSPETLDTRMSHIHLAAYWAEALAERLDGRLAAEFKALFEALTRSMDTIDRELSEAPRPSPAQCGWYLLNGPCRNIMTASPTFNGLLETLRYASARQSA